MKAKRARGTKPAKFKAPFRCGACSKIHILEVPVHATGNVAHSCPDSDNNKVAAMTRLHMSVENATRKWGAR